MSPLNTFYIPIYGAELVIDSYELKAPRPYGMRDDYFISIRKNLKNDRSFNFFKDEKLEGDDQINSFFPTLLDEFDFVVSTPGDQFDYFDGDAVHAIVFLLMMKSGALLHAPIWLIDDPCDELPYSSTWGSLTGTPPTKFPFVSTITLEDVVWAEKHIDSCMCLMSNPNFQNAMQALNTFHNVPYDNFRALIAWTGIEGLFNVEHELRFKLSLLVSKYVSSKSESYQLYRRLKKSYNLRSKIAHGNHVKVDNAYKEGLWIRSILGLCLCKTVEQGKPPTEEEILFDIGPE